MALSCYRLLRACRSVCLPVSTIVAFSFLLSWVFVLYHHSPGPGSIQRMGWQSWESVDETSKSTDLSIPDNSTDSGVDWWNVTSADDSFDYTSLPLDVWNPLLPHITGCGSPHFFIPHLTLNSPHSIRNRRLALSTESRAWLFLSARLHQ